MLGSGGALDSRVEEGRKERQRKQLADSEAAHTKLPQSLLLCPFGQMEL